MKQKILRGTLLLTGVFLLMGGCTYVGDDVWSTQTAVSSPFGGTTPTVSQDTPSAVSTVTDNAYVGSWVHTYEYLDSTYRTTLVINADGTAVYYNEEAALGNFTASWQYSGTGIALQRSDGVLATAVIQGSVLVEQSVENGVTYTAEYQRLS